MEQTNKIEVKTAPKRVPLSVSRTRTKTTLNLAKPTPATAELAQGVAGHKFSTQELKYLRQKEGWSFVAILALIQM